MTATRRSLAADFRALGLAAGDAVLVHAALRSIGPIVGGTDMVLAALRDAVGPSGTVLAYADWQSGAEVHAEDSDRNDIPPFDPLTSRASRDNGWWPELVRTTPGAVRSGNPGASVVALGRQAVWFTADHPLDYGYGPHSPLGKLVETGGKSLLLGCPWDKLTLLHHAEHLADIPHRIERYEAPLLLDGRTVWRQFEEFDTSTSPDGLPEDYFVTVVEEFLAGGNGRRGTIGAAPSVVVEANQIVPFAVAWLERRLKPAS